MTEFRKHKPEPRGTIDFSLPNIEETFLENGIKLLYVHKPGLPITQMELILESGSSFDKPGSTGLAYLTAMLMDEGAGEYNSLELNDEVEKIGSVLNISADKDAIYVAMLSMSEYTERSIELLSKVICSPNFTDADFEREKAKLLTKIIQTEDNPSALANNIFDRLVFPNSYYAHPIIGSTESVGSITPGDVKEFYGNSVIKNNVTAIVVSSQPKSSILEIFNRYLTLPPNTNSQENRLFQSSENDVTRIYIVDSGNSPQSEIRIGHRSGTRQSKDYFSKHLMNAILGGQFSSRINLNLREDKGYTYGASSYFGYNKTAGEFCVSTSVESKVTSDAVNEVMKELKNIRNGARADELEFAKSYLTKRFPAMFETYTQIANHLGTLALYDLGKDYFNTYLKKLNAVQLHDIKSAAVNHVHPENCIILLVGNEKELAAQFKNQSEHKVYLVDKEGNIK